MSRKLAIERLQEFGVASFKCNGNSMRPFMKPGDTLYIKRIDPALYRVDDIVFCKINNNLQVHKISAINNERFQISNARNFVNGWVGRNSIYGLCTQVNNTELVSAETLRDR